MADMTNDEAELAAREWAGQAGGKLLPQLTANELTGIVNEAIQRATGCIDSGRSMTNDQRMVDVGVLRELRRILEELERWVPAGYPMTTSESECYRYKLRVIINGPGVEPVAPIAYMPLMRTGLAIRMDLLNEVQAKKNHYQTLQRLAERGGLSPSEAAAIAEHRKWASQKLDESFKVLVDLAAPSAPVQAVPAVLFDGYAVLQALDAKAKGRTSPENVADVLDAVVRLLRAAPQPPKEIGE